MGNIDKIMALFKPKKTTEETSEAPEPLTPKKEEEETSEAPEDIKPKEEEEESSEE